MAKTQRLQDICCCFSVAKSCIPWLHGLQHARLHYRSEVAQIQIHWVSDAFQPSHPLLPLLFLPSIVPSIRVFSNEALHIRWPKYWSFSSHEIKRCLLLGRKVMINLDSIFKSRDITLRTKLRLVKDLVSCMDVRAGLWRRLSAKELMLLNCCAGEDSWESFILQGDPTSPFWRRSALGILWKEWC